jgi:hypothetical protein
MGRGKAASTLALIDACVDILREIQPASVRAVCYQLFNQKLIPSMGKNETNKVGTQLTWARRQGRVPWGWVVDETRPEERPSSWNDPADYADTVLRSYRKDWWQYQPYVVKVWSEKSTVAGTLRPVLEAHAVGFSAIHGFGSTTKLHDLAEYALSLSKPLILLYVGDFDPSGLHMSDADLFNRLREDGIDVHRWEDVSEYLDVDVYPTDVVVRRLALTEDDVGVLEAEGLTFDVEAKRSDSRYQFFRDHAGGTRCAELDALSPVILRGRVVGAIEELLDQGAWQTAKLIEDAERESITATLGAWKAAVSISMPASKYSPAGAP